VNLADRCFTGIRVQLPSFHAWVAPQLVTTDYTSRRELPSLIVNIGEPTRRKFALKGGAEIEILVYSSAGEENGDFPIRQHTALYISLPEAADYDTVMRCAAALDIMFCFLIGARLETAALHLPTTKTRLWNNVEENITAESWFVPAWKRAANAPHHYLRMFTEANTPVGLERLLELCVSRQDDLTYIMDMIIVAEMHDLPVDHCFVELLGCLEDFDKRQFGIGGDPKVRLVSRRIKKLVEQYGDEEEKAVCARIGAAFRNEFSLRQRLERLIAMWADDGFRGGPDLRRVAKIRNLKPHGRGRELSPEVIREIVGLLPFLSALARYHVLKVLGFNRAAIAAGFARVAHRYGAFVPPDLRPTAVASQTEGTIETA
jgi:hypothetical protein